MADRYRPIVDVHVILERGDDILLLERQGTGYGDGMLHLPLDRGTLQRRAPQMRQAPMVRPASPADQHHPLPGHRNPRLSGRRPLHHPRLGHRLTRPLRKARRHCTLARARGREAGANRWPVSLPSRSRPGTPALLITYRSHTFTRWTPLTGLSSGPAR